MQPIKQKENLLKTKKCPNNLSPCPKPNNNKIPQPCGFIIIEVEITYVYLSYLVATILWGIKGQNIKNIEGFIRLCANVLEHEEFFWLYPLSPLG